LRLIVGVVKLIEAALVSGLGSDSSWKIVNRKARKKERANNLGKSLMGFSPQLLHKSAYF
jgi:hypothetical protein